MLFETKNFFRKNFFGNILLEKVFLSFQTFELALVAESPGA